MQSSAAEQGARLLVNKVYSYPDRAGNLTVDDIVSLPQNQFRLNKGQVFNGGTKGDIWWLKIVYENPGNASAYLVFGYGNVDYLDIYYKNTQNKWVHIRSGTFGDYSSRAILSTEFIHKLPDLSTAAGNNIYVKAKSVNTLILPVKMESEEALTSILINKYIKEGLCIGIATFIFFINIFMYSLTRRKEYIYYLLRVVFLFYLYEVLYFNAYSALIGDKFHQFILIYAQAFVALGFIFSIRFNNLFLNLKTNLPQAKKFFDVITFFWVALFCLTVIGDNRYFTNTFTHILLLVTSLAILISSFYIIIRKNYKSGDNFIGLYVLGWLPIPLSCTYVVLALKGVFELEENSIKMLLIASILEGVFISLALIGNNIKMLNKGKLEAELRNYQLVKERNQFLEEKIKERTHELQTSNDFKNKLISIISHDLRSPLSSLNLTLQLAYKLEASQLSKMLDNIRKNTETVRTTIDSLLNWAVQQMNMEKSHPELIEVESFINEQINVYRELMTFKDLSFSIVYSDSFKIFVDKGQLALVIRNLIDNAIKFTPQNGSIDVIISGSEQKVQFAICNTGNAISNDTIDRILNSNEVLGESYGTLREKGVGLGLQLCKESLRNMGSELFIEGISENSIEKTVFSFEIQRMKS
ncbi:sensor histidine kinase [Pseudopedobacter saltans]|nr:sensor histidine kinase [Pseudopedobacter saltans]